ncbi:MAG: hypothetical protein E7267_03715 [Lachnospiraceae bacterium]|nr:hypothetical protein [Lachnospiraceae bacterium]
MKNNSKKLGSIGKLLPVMLGMCTAAVMSLMYINYMKQMDIREEVSKLARQYTLRMETEGCFTNEATMGLTEKLMSLGGKDISYTGSTFTPCDYGTRIYLCIRVKMPVPDTVFNDLFGIESKETYKEIYIKNSTTAKN